MLRAASRLAYRRNGIINSSTGNGNGNGVTAATPPTIATITTTTTTPTNGMIGIAMPSSTASRGISSISLRAIARASQARPSFIMSSLSSSSSSSLVSGQTSRAPLAAAAAASSSIRRTLMTRVRAMAAVTDCNTIGSPSLRSSLSSQHWRSRSNSGTRVNTTSVGTSHELSGTRRDYHQLRHGRHANGRRAANANGNGNGTINSNSTLSSLLSYHHMTSSCITSMRRLAGVIPLLPSSSFGFSTSTKSSDTATTNNGTTDGKISPDEPSSSSSAAGSASATPSQSASGSPQSSHSSVWAERLRASSQTRADDERVNDSKLGAILRSLNPEKLFWWILLGAILATVVNFLKHPLQNLLGWPLVERILPTWAFDSIVALFMSITLTFQQPWESLQLIGEPEWRWIHRQLHSDDISAQLTALNLMSTWVGHSEMHLDTLVEQQPANNPGFPEWFREEVRRQLIDPTINRMIEPHNIDRLISLSSSAVGVIGAMSINLLFNFIKHDSVSQILCNQSNIEYFLKMASAPLYDPTKMNESSQMVNQLLMVLMPRLPPLDTWGIQRVRSDQSLPELSHLLFFGLQNCVLQLSQLQLQGHSDKISHDLLNCFDRLSELFTDPNSHPVIVSEWAQALQRVGRNEEAAKKVDFIFTHFTNQLDAVARGCLILLAIDGDKTSPLVINRCITALRAAIRQTTMMRANYLRVTAARALSSSSPSMNIPGVTSPMAEADALQAEMVGQLNAGYALLTSLCRQSDKKNDAKAVAREWSANFPNEVQPYVEYGQLLLADKEVDEATTAFTQAHRLQPDYTTAFQLGICHQQLNDIDRAISWYDEAIKLCEPKAIQKSVEQERDEEIAERRRARLAGEAPRLPLPVTMESLSSTRLSLLTNAHRRRAKLYRDTNRAGQALESYRRLLALDNSQPLAHINIARCLLSLANNHTTTSSATSVTATTTATTATATSNGTSSRATYDDALIALADGINLWYTAIAATPIDTTKSSSSSSSSSTRSSGSGSGSGKKSSSGTSGNRFEVYMSSLSHRADYEAYDALQQLCAANAIHPELCQRLATLRSL